MGQVVNHDRTVHVGDCWICAILTPDECPPNLGLQCLSCSSAFPEINPANGSAVLRQQVLLANESCHTLIFRGRAHEDFARLVESDWFR